MDILRCIGKAEVIIADVTTKNPNVFYELGIAHMVKDLEQVLILTQNMEDVPFDLRQFRCIVYQQTAPGLRQLQRTLQSSVPRSSYAFFIRRGEQYKFPHKLLGRDKCFYDFEITEIWVEPDAAKFSMKEYRHVLGQPVDTAKVSDHGVQCGYRIELYNVPWQLVLEETHADTAHFRVVPKK